MEAFRVLIVDDDPDNAEALRAWFHGQPVTIVEARDGLDGLEEAARCHPDVILMDMRMPRLDGLQATRRLKADEATFRIPVILLTACRDVNTKVEAYSAGAENYIEKPYAIEEVDACISAALRKRGMYQALESKNRELEGLLVVDEKTGLANYRHFHRRLKEEWLRAERYETQLSLLMIDLDDFKRVNDSCGHPAGDRALGEFATLVLGGARATDLAARFGGEEFAVILPHTDGPMALRVAERIIAAVRDFTFLAEECPCRITASIGVATWPSFPSVRGAEDLVKAADRALYRAKDLGKDQVFVDDGAVPAANAGS